mmetsp:Transcript_1508/g.1707  ORF Transcript_1508/g.1707 Transcript_1508/m.1707 type:complete len:292 (-) Transcript_1508:118-993(-)
MGTAPSKKNKKKPLKKTNSSTSVSRPPKPNPKGGNGYKKPNGRKKQQSSKDLSSRQSTKYESKKSTKSKEGDGFSNKKVEKLYEKYASIVDPDEDEEESTDPDEIGPAGVEQFLSDAGIDAEGVLSFVLAWHLSAKEIGYFQKEDFIAGMKKLGCDTMDKLKNKKDQFEKEIKNEETFKAIYRFAFHFSKADKDKRQMDFLTADCVLELLLDGRPHVERFRKFIHVQTAYPGLNQDQWMSFLDFSKTINEDFENYDASGAWPVLLDEYGEWVQDGMPEKKDDKDDDDEDEM